MRVCGCVEAYVLYTQEWVGVSRRMCASPDTEFAARVDTGCAPTKRLVCRGKKWRPRHARHTQPQCMPPASSGTQYITLSISSPRSFSPSLLSTCTCGVCRDQG